MQRIQDAEVCQCFYSDLPPNLKLYPSKQAMMKDYPKAVDVKQVLSERGARYGDFITQADLSHRLKNIMRSAPSWDGLSADKKEALEMIQHKIARALNGDTEYKDNFIDIAGFATLIANSLKD